MIGRASKVLLGAKLPEKKTKYVSSLKVNDGDGVPMNGKRLNNFGGKNPQSYAGRNTVKKAPTLAKRAYPGRTNYGSPNDNKIDTSMGYLTKDQYNQGVTGKLQRQGNPQKQNNRRKSFNQTRTSNRLYVK